MSIDLYHYLFFCTDFSKVVWSQVILSIQLLRTKGTTQSWAVIEATLNVS